MILSEKYQKQFEAHRKTIDRLIAKIADNPVEINIEVIENPAAIRSWKPAIYTVDDVRLYNGIPYKCVQTHDSSANETWTPDVNPALWTQYHGTSKETARPWVTPTGAQDIYKVGEWMIWTDGKKYQCIQNTNFSPADYSSAWKIEE